jgi:hypothetical protein
MYFGFYLVTAMAGAIGRDSAAAITGCPYAGFKAPLRRASRFVNRITSSISKSHWSPYLLMSRPRQTHSDFKMKLVKGVLAAPRYK